MQLRSRHWRITDANGRTEEVHGAGVVGKQPVLKPGETLRLYQRLPADDAVRHHGRHLPDAEREGRAVLDRHPRLLARPARRAADGELTRASRDSAVSHARSATASLPASASPAADLIGEGARVVGLRARRRPRSARPAGSRRVAGSPRSQRSISSPRSTAACPSPRRASRRSAPTAPATIERRLPGRAHVGAALRRSATTARDEAFRNYLAAVAAIRTDRLSRTSPTASFSPHRRSLPATGATISG